MNHSERIHDVFFDEISEIDFPPAPTKVSSYLRNRGIMVVVMPSLAKEQDGKDPEG